MVRPTVRPDPSWPPGTKETKARYDSEGRTLYSDDSPGYWLPPSPNYAKGGAVYKHADPTHLKFGRSADSKLLAKGRRNYAEGGPVTPVSGFEPPPGSTSCTASSSGSAALHPWCGSAEDIEQRKKANQ